jgi:23S rRNA (cytosine1962-C5)-methyltransferase
LNFRVDVEAGQKTGFFLDQRENRQRVRALAGGREVLDCFAYTGGFSIAALAGGAKRVLALESSAPALEVARENLAANPLDAARLEFAQADVFAHLRQLRDRGFGIRPRRARSAEVRADRGAGPRTPRAPTRTSTCSR